METRFVFGILVMLLAIAAAAFCHQRLSALRPMRDTNEVSKAVATVTRVTTPMVKRDQATRDVKSDVDLRFTAQGREIHGSYSIRGRNNAPQEGSTEAVVYRTAQPEIFLRATEYDDLPRQLSALNVMRFGFLVGALVALWFALKR